MSSRYAVPTGEEVNWTEDDPEILHLFSRFPILRTEWIAAFFPHRNYTALLDRLKVFYNGGYLERFVWDGKHRIVDGRKVKINNNEQFSWKRTELGTRKIAKKYFLPRMNYHQDPERALIDITRASLALGAMRDNRKIELWPDLFAHPATPPELFTDKTPFRFVIKAPDPDKKSSRGEYLVQDGEPCRLYGPDGKKSVGLINETDLHNMQIEYSEINSSIGYKLLHYEKFWKAKVYQRYGFGAAFLQLTTVNERHMYNIADWIKREIGPASWILLKVQPDHTDFGDPTPLHTRFYDEPYFRVGHKPFSLKEMREV